MMAMALAAHGQPQTGQAPRSDTQTRPSESFVPRPHSRPDQSLLSISGTVGAVTATAFTLDYGRGRIDVELDDVDRDPETFALRSGDRVTVRGRIDDDFFSAARVEASSVYVERLDAHFVASDVDEEDGEILTVTPDSPVGTASLRGVVTEAHGRGFTMDSGARSVFVSVEAMDVDPLNEPGNQRIEVGDTVAVHGTIDDDFLEHRRIEATAVTTVIEGAD
jgi:uncharacterized protein YdeI (BOF family)